MSVYNPDTWVVLKIQSPEHDVVHKILAGWYGGYLDGDSWKINSGITKVVDTGDFWEVYGYSGSMYKCYKASEKLSGVCAGILSHYSEKMKELGEKYTIEVVDAEAEFKRFIGPVA